jgi:hypothetical protein
MCTIPYEAKQWHLWKGKLTTTFPYRESRDDKSENVFAAD